MWASCGELDALSQPASVVASKPWRHHCRQKSGQTDPGDGTRLV